MCPRRSAGIAAAANPRLAVEIIVPRDVEIIAVPDLREGRPDRIVQPGADEARPLRQARMLARGGGIGLTEGLAVHRRASERTGAVGIVVGGREGRCVELE